MSELIKPSFWPCDPADIPLLTMHAAAAKSLQSCPTLCDPIDGSPPDSPVPGILQARTLDWVTISFSNAGQYKNLHTKWFVFLPKFKI